MPPTGSSYFDAAAGLPLHPVAVEAWQAAVADGWADPSRLHGAGRRSALLLAAAREAAAEEFDRHPDEISFHPSGLHALQLAVLGTLVGNQRRGRPAGLVHSAVEHSSVLRAAAWHAERGGPVRVVGVDEHGRVDPAEFLAAAREPGTAAAVLQAANHEVGTRQPVAEVLAGLAELTGSADLARPADLAGSAGVANGGSAVLVVDASHELVFGRPPVAPVITADARLWGGPAGVGVLAVRRGTRWRSPVPADETEAGRALGAPNVPGIVAAVAALRAVRADRDDQARRLAGLVDQLRIRVPQLVPDALVLGAESDRLPHLVTFCCLYVDGQSLLTELDRHGFAVSSGSSCTSDTLTPSHVLVAMGAPTGGNVRISLHRGIGQDDLDRFLAVLPEAVASARQGVLINAAEPAVEHPRADQADRPDQVGQTGQTVVDSRGRRCPLPVLDLARVLPQLPVGGELTVLADDPAAASDLAAWCRMTGHKLVSTEPATGSPTEPATGSPTEPVAATTTRPASSGTTPAGIAQPAAPGRTMTGPVATSAENISSTDQPTRAMAYRVRRLH